MLKLPSKLDIYYSDMMNKLGVGFAVAGWQSKELWKYSNPLADESANETVVIESTGEKWKKVE